MRRNKSLINMGFIRYNIKNASSALPLNEMYLTSGGTEYLAFFQGF
ncbi:hypothetical protein [Brachyspira hyodysenteriae]|nr:hypothetical protein [Brachyspira hyodysenteriae]MCZ9966178.1 hypothetical protein [Brachyspira hyodysenteriae]